MNVEVKTKPENVVKKTNSIQKIISNTKMNLILKFLIFSFIIHVVYSAKSLSFLIF